MTAPIADLLARVEAALELVLSTPGMITGRHSAKKVLADIRQAKEGIKIPDDSDPAGNAITRSRSDPKVAPDAAALLALCDRLDGLMAKATLGPLSVYDSNSWRRIGLTNGYKEILWPVVCNDKHPDFSGINREADLAALVAAFNAAPTLTTAARRSVRMEKLLRDLLYHGVLSDQVRADIEKELKP